MTVSTPPTPTPPPDTRWRPARPVTALAVLLVLAVLGVGAFQLAGESFRGVERQETTLGSAVPRLTVALDAGSVALEPSGDGAVHVTTTVTYGVNRPELRADTGPDGVVLGSRCSGHFVSTCATDYRIAVPPGFALDVTQLSGPVTARDLTGPVRLAVTSGRIGATGLSGDVRLSTLSDGDVTATGLRARTVSADARSGSVRLDLDARPVQVSAQTASGDVDVAVPAGSYRVDAVSPVRPPQVGVASDDGADAGVRARSDTGSVTVRAG